LWQRFVSFIRIVAEVCLFYKELSQRFVSFIRIVGRDPDPAHCLAATAPIGQGGRHVYAAEKAAVTRLAFSSCLWTESVLGNPSAAEQFWTDVRNVTHSCN
jgi:hypothetical protein